MELPSRRATTIRVEIEVSELTQGQYTQRKLVEYISTDAVSDMALDHGRPSAASLLNDQLERAGVRAHEQLAAQERLDHGLALAAAEGEEV